MKSKTNRVVERIWIQEWVYNNAERLSILIQDFIDNKKLLSKTLSKQDNPSSLARNNPLIDSLSQLSKQDNFVKTSEKEEGKIIRDNDKFFKVLSNGSQLFLGYAPPLSDSVSEADEKVLANDSQHLDNKQPVRVTRKSKISNDMKPLLKNLYTRGVDIKDIAKALRLSKSLVTCYLTNVGLYKPKTRSSKIDSKIAFIREEIKKGKRISAIADELCVSRGMVERFVKRKGLVKM